jgi:hypothetical protein
MIDIKIGMESNTNLVILTFCCMEQIMHKTIYVKYYSYL